MDIRAWLLCACAVLGAGEVRRGGWLDRIVYHHKHRLIEDIKLRAPFDIQASIQKAPAGYVDSPLWDADSVARLMKLLRASEKARPVRIALRRALFPSRRSNFKHFSHNLFPSIQEDIYYGSSEYEEDVSVRSSTMKYDKFWPLNAVVVVQNPVEARLPSARISLTLLKDILEARAVAARKMPPTKSTPPLRLPTQTSTAKTTKSHRQDYADNKQDEQDNDTTAADAEAPAQLDEPADDKGPAKAENKATPAEIETTPVYETMPVDNETPAN